MLFVDHLRAGEGKQDAARFDLLESDGIEFAIPLQGVSQDILVLGESGRVQDDEVIVATHVLQVFESVLGESLVTGITRKVERYIFVGQGDGLRRAIDRVYHLGPSTHRIEGEAACVAEHIKTARSLA